MKYKYMIILTIFLATFTCKAIETTNKSILNLINDTNAKTPVKLKQTYIGEEIEKRSKRIKENMPSHEVAAIMGNPTIYKKGKADGSYWSYWTYRYEAVDKDNILRFYSLCLQFKNGLFKVKYIRSVIVRKKQEK